MRPVELADGAMEIDASIVAEGLGIALPRLREGMRNGTITSMTERGIDADQGRHRLTFFCEHRRFRVVVDASGTILQRSAVDFGASMSPKSLRKLGR